MNKITEHLYLGNFEDANVDERELTAMGITAVLNVGFELWPEHDYHPDVIRYVKVGLMDNFNNLHSTKRLAIDALKHLLTDGETVLCHCAMGASRSAYVVICALAEMQGKTYHEVYDMVHNERPIVILGPLFANI